MGRDRDAGVRPEGVTGGQGLLAKDVEDGVARAESSYCFPAEIAHGAVQDIVNKGTDYIIVPHFRDMPSYENDVHANFCPITQGLPYYLKKAFPEKEWSMKKLQEYGSD